MKIQTICVLGGTGFVGGHLVAHLANGGYRVRVLTRHRERHRELLVMPRVELIEADIFDPAVLQRHFTACEAVINLVGILNGSEQEFRAVHAELPQRVAEASRKAGVWRLLQMSALNADPVNGASRYLRSKGEGEQAVLQASAEGIAATCFRPSVIFGPDDSFFNRFAGLLAWSPVLPLACSQARFAPVYVGDVADALVRSLANPATFGKVLELCGPRAYTLKELVEYTAHLMSRKRWILGLPDGLSRLQAKIFEHLPGRLFTLDNYRSMQIDSVCSADGLGMLGIVPHSVEAVMEARFAGKNQRSSHYRFRREARRD